MTPNEVVSRARSAVGRNTTYMLGAGGNKPTKPVPANILGQCDCSGFIAWVFGTPRKVDNDWYAKQNGGWIETTAVAKDAELIEASHSGIFAGVEWKDARPSDIVVWGDHTDNSGEHHEGHVGIVTEVDSGGPRSVVHCSHGNWAATGDAIQETDVLMFAQHHAKVARCTWVMEVVA